MTKPAFKAAPLAVKFLLKGKVMINMKFRLVVTTGRWEELSKALETASLS